jgi:hypothetical protein
MNLQQALVIVHELQKGGKFDRHKAMMAQGFFQSLLEHNFRKGNVEKVKEISKLINFIRLKIYKINV